MNKTTHIKERSAQRGFTESQIQAIIQYGDTYKAGKGQVAYWIGSTRFKDLVKKKIFLAKDSKMKNSAVVFDPTEDLLITVMHCNFPPNHWEKL